MLLDDERYASVIEYGRDAVIKINEENIKEGFESADKGGNLTPGLFSASCTISSVKFYPVQTLFIYSLSFQKLLKSILSNIVDPHSYF